MLSVYEFGKRLLETNDLDPVYVLLHGANLEPVTLRRWLIAYWCFYHVGTSSWASDVRREEDYWTRLETAAGSKEYPRAHERRHFRGSNAAKSVAFLKGRGIDALWGPLLTGERFTVKGVMDYVRTWIGFGPWISFKVADMLERLGIAEVSFDAGAMFLFDSPAEGAELLFQEEGAGDRPKDVGQWAVDRILKQLGSEKAPPRYERLINVQEAETVLCKFKSYRGSHYKIGEDVAACRKGLLRFARCRTSQRLLSAMRKANLGGTNHA